MPTNTYAQPFFQPAMRFISGITQTNPIVVTTIGNHLYGTGLTVRLVVPVPYGMYQANELTGEIIVIDDTSFSMPIDGTNFNAFMTPLSYQPAQAQVIGIAEDALILSQAERNVLPYKN